MSGDMKPRTTSLLIRNLDSALHERLKERALANHHTLAEEVRERLRRSLVQENCASGRRETIIDIADRIFGPERGFNLELPPRSAEKERLPLDFSGPEYDP